MDYKDKLNCNNPNIKKLIDSIRVKNRNLALLAFNYGLTKFKKYSKIMNSKFRLRKKGYDLNE